MGTKHVVAAKRGLVFATKDLVQALEERFGPGVLVYNANNAEDVVWFTQSTLNPFIRNAMGKIVAYSLAGSGWNPLSEGTGWRRAIVVNKWDGKGVLLDELVQ